MVDIGLKVWDDSFNSLQCLDPVGGHSSKTIKGVSLFQAMGGKPQVTAE